MANKQIKVDLIFGADTSQAINNMNQLNSLLTNISKNTTVGVDGGSLQQAVNSAKELQKHLSKAVDVDTGKLDLNKFNNSLKQSGTSLQTLASRLQAVGPAGQQAFIKVANAISQAQTPLFKLNGSLKSFADTLVNTTKWQIASTAIHRMTGAMSSAIRHAEDLNRALNDIQIVTGYNDVTMSRFVDSAAKAAKELSTTTTEYSKASLIFYQQGLDGQAVEKRANTVIKLSQVTGQSAQQVSDQMTSVWNNFADGSEELEYYADVLTKLGADTAASTDEISAGLQKFSAVARTVGLEYETAAAAVATVVDKTRESAEVVGTSFKTIFARLENLKMGETLEDGVDLTKYTEALEGVGVKVLDTDGQLRDMESILDELGSKWSGFSRTTQVALAQTVGGVRQYNQMIALMDNWTDVEANIEKAKNAGGELQHQADIWSKSYEAAAERVKNAQNELYESFIDDQSVVKLTDIFAQLIGTVTDLVDSIGGIGPFILTIAGLFSKTLLPIASSVFSKIGNFIKIHTGQALRETIELQRQASAELSRTLMNDNLTATEREAYQLSKDLVDVKMKLAVSSKNASAAEQEEMRARVENYEALNLEIQKTLERKKALEEEINTQKKKMDKKATRVEMAEYGSIGEYRNETEQAMNTRTSNILGAVTSNKEEGQQAVINLQDKINEKLKESHGVRTEEIQQLEEILRLQKAINEAVTQEQVTEITDDYVYEKEFNRQARTDANIDEATTRSSEDVQSELTRLTNRQKEKINIESQLAGASEAEQQTEEYKKLEERLKAIGEIDEDRIADLEEILQLQEKINSESKKSVSDISVGKISTKESVDAFQSQASGQNGEQTKNDIFIGDMASSIMNNTVNSLGGTNGEIEVSLSVLEQLIEKVQETKTVVAEMKAVYSEIIPSIKDSTAANTELIAAKEELKQAKKTLAEAEAKSIKLAKSANDKTNKHASSAQKKLAIALKEQEEAQKKATQAQQRLNQVQEKANKINTQSAEEVLKAEKAIKDFAKTVQLGKDETDLLNEAFNKLRSQSSEEVKAGLDTISETLSNMSVAADQASQGMDAMAQDMIDMLAKSGMSKDQITELVNKLEKVGAISADTANKMKQLAVEMNNVAAAPSFSSSMATITQSLTSMAGSAMSAYSGFNMLFSALDEGKTPAEKIMGIMSGLTMILPVVGTLFKNLADTKKDDAASSLAAAGANIVESAAIEGTTAATWKGVAANIAHLLSSPWTMAIAAVAIAAIAGVCAWISKDTEETEKNTQAQIENAQATRETEKANRENLKTFNELLDTYQKTGEGKADLDEAAQKLADAYDIEGAALARLTGNYADYKDVADAAFEAHQKELESRYDAESKALKVSSDKLLQTTLDESGNATSIKDGTFLMTLDGSGDESVATKYFQDGAISSEFLKGIRGTNDVDLKIDDINANPEKLIQFYDELHAIYTDMGDDKEAIETGIYSDLQAIMGYMSDDVEKAREHLKEVEELKTVLGKVEGLEGVGKELQDVKTLEEYTKWINKVTAALQKEGKTQEEINKVIDTFTNTTTNAAIDQLKYYNTALNEIKSKQGFGNELNEYFNILSEEDKQLFLTIDFDAYKTEEAWNNQMEILRGKAEIADLKVKVDATIEIKGSIKEDMTEDDWQQVYKNSVEKGIEWGKNGIMSFNSFMRLSYEDQVQYMDELSNKISEERKKLLEEEISRQKESLEILEEQLLSTNNIAEMQKIEEKIEKVKVDLQKDEIALFSIEDEEIDKAEELLDILSDMKDIALGDIITMQQYNLLVGYNAELRKYFQILSTGAKFTGSVIDFQQELKQVQKDIYDKRIEDQIVNVNDAKATYDENVRLASILDNGPIKTPTFKENSYYETEEYNALFKHVYGYTPQPGDDAYIAGGAHWEARNEAVAKNANKKVNYEKIAYEAQWWDKNWQDYLTTNSEGEEIYGNVTTSRESWQATSDAYAQILADTEGTDALSEEDRTALQEYVNSINQHLGATIGDTITMDVETDMADAAARAGEYAAIELENIDAEINAAFSNTKKGMEEKGQDLVNTIYDAAENIDDSRAEYFKSLTALKQVYNDAFSLAEDSQERLKTFKEYEQSLGVTIDFDDEVAGSPLEAAYLESAHAAMTQEAEEGLDPEEYAIYAEYLEEEFGILEEEAEDVAAAVMKMNRGIETLNSNWAQWSDILKRSEKNSQEYVKALTETKKAISDVLDVSEEFISADFLEKNLELIGKAAQGSTEAIDALGIALAETIALSNLENLEVTEALTLEEKNEKIQELQRFLDEIQALLQQSIGRGTINLGDSISGEDLLFQKLQEVVEMSQMTVEQANAYYRSMGFTPQYETVTLEEAKTVPVTATAHVKEYPDPENPDSWIEYEYVVDSHEVDAGKMRTTLGALNIATADGEGGEPEPIKIPSTKVKSLTYTGGGSMSNFSSGNAGGNKTFKPKDRKKDTDVTNRYENIKNKISDLDREMDRASRTSDKLFGANKLAAMDKENQLLSKKIGLYKQYQGELKNNLELDRQNLVDAAAATGVGGELKFENGHLVNGDDILLELKNQYNEALDAAEADQVISESEQTLLDDIDERINNFKEAKDQYGETVEELKEVESQIQEFIDQRQENNYAKFTYQLELKLKVEGLEQKEIDYYLSKFDGDFYKMAESASLIMTQIDNSTDKLADLQQQQTDALTLFTTIDETTGETMINEAQYVEQLEEIYGSTYDTLTTLQELDQQMMDYYGNTLAMAQEELSKYVDKMSKLNSVVDHYTSLLEIMGQQQNYTAKNLMLEAQVELKADQFEVNQSIYEEAISEVEKKTKAYEDAVATHGADSKAAEMAKKELEDAEAWAAESQEAMFTSAEEWASAIAASTQNKLDGIYNDVEKFLTNGLSFDQQNTERDHMLSLQEGWLDETNKVYETNKMIRDIQSEIDKTTNNAAKTRLKSFMDQTKQMQQQKELSQFELEQQQRKYDLLLAEIALEEAQNAKSTVTLQRDAEGNYGYVYTAEESDVADKQQAVDDAENAIYNSSLEEAQNKATELQTLSQEHVQRMQEIDQAWLDGMYASEEEYLHAKEEANNYYTQKMLDTQYGYMIALAGTDEEKLTAAHTYREKSIENEQKRLEDLEVARQKYEKGDFPSREAYLDEVERINNESYGRLETMSDDYLIKIQTNNSLMASPWLQAFGDPDNPSNNPGSILEIVSKSFGAINGVLSTHETRMNEVATNVGIDLEEIKIATDAGKGSFDQYAQTLNQIDLTKAGEKFGGLGARIGEVTTKSDELVKKITDPTNGVIKKISDQIDKVSEVTTEYQNMRDAVDATCDELERFAKDIKEEITDKTVNITFSPTEYPSELDVPDTQTSTVTYTAVDYPAPIPDQDVNITYHEKTVKEDEEEIYIELPLRSLYTQLKSIEGTEKDLVKQRATQAGYLGGAYASWFDTAFRARSYWLSGMSDQEALEKAVRGFDTGGYTGAWGQAGKLAVLHEKEIVLNKEDTKNFLDAISILRSTNSITLDNILQQIENQIIQMSLAYTDLVNSLRFEKEKDILQQEVSINVEFPNVTNSDEIERAFENIVNEAAQYAYRR